MDYFDYSGEAVKTGGRRGGENKRDKRLERNRESARKCRRKRKAYVGDMEEKCQILLEENALLQLEKKRLQELITQLQGPDSKRQKGENGVSMAIDFSESAAGEFFSAGHLDHLSAPLGDLGDDLIRNGVSDIKDDDSETEPSTSGESEGWHEGAAASPVVSDELGCELASLYPLPGTSVAGDLSVVKVEELQDLPPAGPAAQGLIDGLQGDPCSELVSNFVSDVTTDPVSLDDLLEI